MQTLLAFGLLALIVLAGMFVAAMISRPPSEPKPKKLTRHERSLQRTRELEQELGYLNEVIDKTKGNK